MGQYIRYHTIIKGMVFTHHKGLPMGMPMAVGPGHGVSPPAGGQPLQAGVFGPHQVVILMVIMMVMATSRGI